MISQDHLIKESCDFMGMSPAKFVGYRHCDSGDVMVLVCHVILQHHMIKGLCDFMEGSHSC